MWKVEVRPSTEISPGAIMHKRKRPIHADDNDMEFERSMTVAKRRNKQKFQMIKDAGEISGDLTAAIHRDPKTQLAFVVWASLCKDGGVPSKQFDSLFATAQEANARARVVFYGENPLHVPVEELIDQDEKEKKDRHGLVQLDTRLRKENQWTVLVQPASEFGPGELASFKLTRSAEKPYSLPRKRMNSRGFGTK
ncbi:Aste57867_22848 [Aphanomyces stellatus]|uniref:Aste57867_22848 protein n=1 Tax=Aphanomyces stellatus TaxID=120398 RepID=A0A485LL86_9STRA|nr:hypothetical protein As57867_022777 [Aphanomyces stellatus]VFT99499.1 Aste57867_22848 [Aphanomyces stellatus]